MGCYLSIVKIYGDRATLGRVKKWGEVGKSVFANADTRPQVTAPRLLRPPNTVSAPQNT